MWLCFRCLVVLVVFLYFFGRARQRFSRARSGRIVTIIMRAGDYPTHTACRFGSSSKKKKRIQKIAVVGKCT